MAWLYHFCVGVCALVFRIVYPYRIIRKPKVEGAAIFCANHISLIDMLFLAFTSRRMVHYMAKAELFENKFAGAFFRAVGAFPVVRGTSAAAGAARTANHLLEEGKVVGIFPEGTRSKDGELLKGKPGVAMFAHQQQVPIVPVAICCRSPKPKMFRRVLMVCGEPIQPSELGIVKGSGVEYRNATRMLMQRIADLQAEGRKMLNYTPELPEKTEAPKAETKAEKGE